MKKLLSCILVIVLITVCLTACNKYTGEIAYEDENDHYIFTLQEFSGTYKVRLKRTDLNEGCIHFRANLTQGSISVSYHIGGNTLVHNPEPLFTAEAGKPLSDQGGYVEGDTVSIIFEADAPVSGEITLSFAKHSHTGKWIQNESTHYYQYTCGCPSPDIAELHIDADNDSYCDICGYQIPPAPTNHFLRNQAGCQWLNEITADDIAEIKMIRSASGVAPGSLKNISSSTNRSPIERLFEQYYWLDTTPVAAEDVRVPGGSTLTVQFILTDGTVKELTFDNEAYFDSNGNAFKPLYIPTFNDVPEFTSYYSFVSYEGTGRVLYDNSMTITENAHFFCNIPLDELAFTIVDSFAAPEGGVPANGPINFDGFILQVYDGLVIETEFGNLWFPREDIFHISGHYTNGTLTNYKLVGKDLFDLIAEYSGHYSVTMNDPEWLYENLAPTYKAGDTVTVKIRSALDLGFLFLVNGEKIMPGSADGLYWEFSFTMPDNDVVIDFKTYDGFLPDANYAVLIETFWMHDLRADYVSIRKYYGEFSSGALVAMIDSADYPCVEWEETVGDTVITYGDGNRILVLYSGEFYTLPEAYTAGLLTDADLAAIAKLHEGR